MPIAFDENPILARRLEVTASRSGKGVYVRLPQREDLQASFRAAFSTAEYYEDRRSWYLRGTTAENRVKKWAVANLAGFDAAEAADAGADGGAPLASTKHVSCKVVGKSIEVSFPAKPEAVALIKQVPGARFIRDGRHWVCPLSESGAVRSAIADITNVIERAAERSEADATRGKLSTNRVSAFKRGDGGYLVAFAYHPEAVERIRRVPGARFIHASRSWHIPELERPALRDAISEITAILDQAAEAQVDAASAAAGKASHATPPRATPRLLFRVEDAPRAGRIFSFRKSVYVAVRHARRRRIDEDMPSMHPDLLGYEGEEAVEVEVRSPTPTEMDDYERLRRAVDAAREALHEAKAGWDEITARFKAVAIRPAGRTTWPEGTVLVEAEPSLALYGGGETWLFAPAEGLWLIAGNGADGDDWSENNLPGAVGLLAHGPTGEALAEEIRAADARVRQARAAMRQAVADLDGAHARPAQSDATTPGAR